MRRSLAVAAATASLVIAGCGGASHSPGVPPHPATATTACEAPVGAGSMGVCNPARESTEALTLSHVPLTATLGGIQGVDISNNNGPVSFGYLRRHGIRFVYAKATELCSIDSELAANAAGAAATHIAFGIYAFSHPGRISPASEAACMAARERQVLHVVHRTLPVVFDVEVFDGLGGQAVCNWLHAAESDLRADLPGVLIGVYGSPGTFPGCFPNGTAGWTANWLVSFPAELPGYTAHFNWQWFGPRFASGRLEGMDRDRGATDILSLVFPKAKPSKRQLHAALKAAERRRQLERAFLERHHCRQPPWHVAVGLSGRPNGHYEHACHVELRHGASTNRHIRQLRREGAR